MFGEVTLSGEATDPARRDKTPPYSQPGMRHRLLLLTVLVLAASAPAAHAQSPAVSTTGNVLVLLPEGRASQANAARAVQAEAARLGGHPAGRSVPQIGLITLRPSPRLSMAEFLARLGRLPGVASVQQERRYVPRLVPNDPALRTPDPNSAVLQWTLAREGFYTAWDYHTRRRRARGRGRHRDRRRSS